MIKQFYDTILPLYTGTMFDDCEKRIIFNEIFGVFHLIKFEKGNVLTFMNDLSNLLFINCNLRNDYDRTELYSIFVGKYNDLCYKTYLRDVTELLSKYLTTEFISGNNHMCHIRLLQIIYHFFRNESAREKISKTFPDYKNDSEFRRNYLFNQSSYNFIKPTQSSDNVIIYFYDFTYYILFGHN